ncbi:hypothetical protein E2562_014508 [Oryza meyeriana var. granulata]|uniref:Uncharacterized protein n=1 Tax=Oryza meyeriana var. granulata TaxID=110450 RepID=A0A6G1EL58_9ORYZ|nr:hypothetical protein E2562_014508 [Oryza meyeriana var. granulata]
MLLGAELGEETRQRWLQEREVATSWAETAVLLAEAQPAEELWSRDAAQQEEWSTAALQGHAEEAPRWLAWASGIWEEARCIGRAMQSSGGATSSKEKASSELIEWRNEDAVYRAF